jgi:Predicted glycosyl hydrolase
MEQKGKQALIGTILVLIVIIISGTTILIKKFTPSNEVMKLSDYYKIKNNEAGIILQDKIYDKKALLLNGVVYLDYDTVVENLNKRFYWDANENILIYTTPTEVIKTDLGSKDYYINKSKNSLKHQIVKSEGNSVYIAVDYVKKFSNIKYKIYQNPNRIVIDYKWGENTLYSNVKKATQLRYAPSIKSDILLQLKSDQVLKYVNMDQTMPKGFSRVMTVDGVIGYVKNNKLEESYYKKSKSDYTAPEYSHIKKDYTINLVWHQVTNQTANNNLLNALGNTKGVTTVSPTWFSVTSNDGDISSLASERYVDRAHNAGVEVWGLCNDFSKDVNMYKVLSSTSSREKLINKLIAYAIQYNLDGLNIDFERIKKETGIHYVEFLRELSVKCRNNGIVLSIDNYVPSAYTNYYNRAEQGEVADYVIIMAYDEHYTGSEKSGSVSSIGYVKDAIQNTLKEIPAERTIIAIPFYTRVWKEVTNDGKVSVSSASYGMSEAENLLKDHSITAKWDDTTQQYYGQFMDGGAVYKVWLEESKSIEVKMKAIAADKVAGVACWKLGLEKPSVWDVIIKYVN